MKYHQKNAALAEHFLSWSILMTCNAPPPTTTICMCLHKTKHRQLFVQDHIQINL